MRTATAKATAKATHEGTMRMRLRARGASQAAAAMLDTPLVTSAPIAAPHTTSARRRSLGAQPPPLTIEVVHRKHDNSKYDDGNNNNKTSQQRDIRKSLRPRIGATGTIRSRTSSKTLLTRQWQTTHWVYLRPAAIAVFRSEADVAAWLDKTDPQQPVGELMKDKRVLAAIDFDTQGKLDMTAATRHDEKERSNKLRKISNTRVQSSKIVSRIIKYSLTEVHTKLYGKEPL